MLRRDSFDCLSLYQTVVERATNAGHLVVSPTLPPFSCRMIECIVYPDICHSSCHGAGSKHPRCPKAAQFLMSFCHKSIDRHSSTFHPSSRSLGNPSDFYRQKYCSSWSHPTPTGQSSSMGCSPHRQSYSARRSHRYTYAPRGNPNSTRKSRNVIFRGNESGATVPTKHTAIAIAQRVNKATIR